MHEHVWKCNADYTHTCIICGELMVNGVPDKHNAEYNEEMVRAVNVLNSYNLDVIEMPVWTSIEDNDAFLHAVMTVIDNGFSVIRNNS